MAGAIYDDAKFRMSQFYYDFVDKYGDRSDFQYMEMDTDSAYFAITAETINQVIKPEMQADFNNNWKQWLVDPDNTFSRRVSGLFKEEAVGSKMICLASNMYILGGVER